MTRDPWKDIYDAAKESDAFWEASLYGLRMLALIRCGLNREGVADVLATGPDGGLTAAIQYHANLSDDGAELLELAVVRVLEEAVEEAAMNAWWAASAVRVGTGCCEPSAVVAAALPAATNRWMRQARIYAPDPSVLLDEGVPDEGC